MTSVIILPSVGTMCMAAALSGKEKSKAEKGLETG
jgi:hypothetical protein